MTYIFPPKKLPVQYCSKDRDFQYSFSEYCMKFPNNSEMTLALAYKNFAANRNISHIGLGVAALNTSKVLHRAGIQSEVWPILNAADLRARLAASPKTHVVISAPWIPSQDLQRLTLDFPDVHFAVVCHS